MRKAQERTGWASTGGTRVAPLSHISRKKRRKENFHLALSDLHHKLRSCWPTITYVRSVIKQQCRDSEGGIVPFGHYSFYIKYIAPHLLEQHKSD